MLRRRSLIAGLLAAATASAAGGWGVARRGERDAPAPAQVLAPPEVLAGAAAGRVVLVDVRRPDEWAATGIPAGAHAIDMRREDFAEALLAVAGSRAAPVALICARGVRSRRMAARLRAAGFARVADVPEGMLGSRAGPGWLGRGLPVERP